MSVTWSGPPEPPFALRARHWPIIVARALPLVLILVPCFALLLVLRGPERLIWGLRRPVTPWITQGVCVLACGLVGLKRRVSGTPLAARGDAVYVANHSSWLDIFALNACTRLYFVAKAEVRGWPGIGWLARGTGTLFISRNRAAARAQADAMAARLHAGHRLLFFPEGTSTDGRQVLPFRSTLFEAFFAPGLRAGLRIQPISLIYHAPEGEDARYYGWWGGMGFMPNLLKILATTRPGCVEVVLHPPLQVADFADRKTLARAAEVAVRDGFEARVRRRPAPSAP